MRFTLKRSSMYFESERNKNQNVILESEKFILGKIFFFKKSIEMTVYAYA